MRTKFELIMIVFQIELCWFFIKALRRKAENNFEKGECFVTVISTHKRLQGYCDKIILLTYKYNKMCSIGSRPMEQDRRQIVAK